MALRALGPLVVTLACALTSAGCLGAPEGRAGTGGASGGDSCTNGADAFCRCAGIVGAPCTSEDQSNAVSVCDQGLASGDTILCFAAYASSTTTLDGCNTVINACSSSTGTGGTTGGGGTGGTSTDAGSCPPNSLTCGTDANGVETACPDGMVCCFTPGPSGSTTCGTSSVCRTPGAPSGTADQCPSGQYQLCKIDAECGTGYTCSAPTEGFCL